MPGQWRGSDRRQRLPPDWEKIRKRVLRRDGHRCTVELEDGERCPRKATDVDHVIPGDDHRMENLTSLCGPHHDHKSAREGGQAAAARRRVTAAKFRRREVHPGLLP